jgi:hypothetical protein
MDDLISRQAAINALENDKASLDHIIRGMSAYDVRLDAYVSQRNQVDCDIDTINNLPSAQPEIIRCKDCKHWTQSTGKMTGYGLGRCDFHDADLVACNGFCYWAERRTDE